MTGRWAAAGAIAVLAVALPGARAGQAAPTAHRRTLASGLEIIVVEHRLAPVVSLAIAIRHGVMAEGPKQSGRAHLFEHMLFRPNQALPTEALLTARRRELGLTLPGGTHEEVIYVGATGPAASLDGALEFVRDMVVRPRFEAAALAPEKRLIAIEEGHRSGDERGGRTARADRLLWWKYLSRKTNHLVPERLPALTVADLIDLQQRYLAPDNAALVVVGDVDAARVLERGEGMFGGWTRGRARPGAPPVPRHPPLRRRQVLVEPVATPMVAGAFVWHGPSAPGQESSLSGAAQLLAAAFDIGAGKLDAVRKRCRGFELVFTPSPNVGTLVANWLAEPGSTDACVRAIFDELPAAARSVTDDDLRAARLVAEGDIVRAREQPEVLVRDLARAWAAGDVSACLQAVPRLGSVTRGDVDRLVDRFLVGQPFLLSVHLPPEQIAGGMNVRHFEALLARPPRRANP